MDRESAYPSTVAEDDDDDDDDGDTSVEGNKDECGGDCSEEEWCDDSASAKVLSILGLVHKNPTLN